MNTRNTQTTSGTENRLDRYGNPPLTPEKRAAKEEVRAAWYKIWDDMPEVTERAHNSLMTIRGDESPRMRALKEKYIARQKAKEQQGG